MELMPGYKQTGTGMIPLDWELSTLGEICATSSGTTPARNLADRYYRNGTINWVKTLDLNNSEILDTDELVTVQAIEETSLRLYPIGTVLVAMYGGFNQIGRTGLLRIPAAVNQAITAVQPRPNTLLPEYLLATFNFKIDYWKTVASSSRKDPNITSQDVRAFPIAYPELYEQRAIAVALSDVDFLISGLDQLISKRRDIKQAAMQQLLTGQTRLPGFSGKWEDCRLDELGTWKGGMTPSMQNPSYWREGTVPWISSGDVKSVRLTTTGFSITALAVKSGTTTLLPANSIVIVTRSGILRKYLPVAMNMIPMAINQDIKALIPNEKVIPTYLLHVLIGSSEKILARCLKSGTTVESIEFPWLKAFTVPTPSLAEQTAIAAILTDMDSVLAALEDRRDKTRAIKEGMMQELLTGRIRLV